MKLYYHPLSSYSQKVLIALYEKQVSFTPIALYPGSADDRVELAKITPIGKVPVLVLDNGWKIPESSIIIEYIDAHASGPRLIPEDRDLARQTRFHDRIADLYVNDSLRTIVREADATERVAKARERLDAMFAGIDAHLANRPWIMGDTFTLADCSLIPPLANHRDAHPLDRWKHLSAYVDRAFDRPSVARVRREHAAYMTKAAS
ncbi:MAG TPA: glutathione S-transferase family protein [Kofleriaceae bacterium]